MAREVRKSAVVAVFGMALLAALVDSSVMASPFNKLTLVTVSRTVAVPGATLAPGEYAFSLVNPDTGRNVILVSNRARTRHYAQFLTRPIQRPAKSNPSAMLTLGEARPGEPAPIRAWFPHGEQIGYEFIY